MSWMIPTGIVLAVVLLLYFLFRGGSKLSAEHRARFERGVKASAVINRVEQPGAGSSRGSTTIVVRVYLTVTPPSGAPYDAISGIRLKVVHAPQVQPGKMLRVRIAADNPQIVYPDVEWGEMELLTITRAGRGFYQNEAQG